MPARNGTGPMGMGAMTGRGIGVCAEFVVQGKSYGGQAGPGLRRGCCSGGGYGRRNRSNAAGLPGWARKRLPDEVQHESVLTGNECEHLKNALANISARLKEVEAGQAKQ